MILIDKTKPTSPILEYVPKPDFKTTLEKQKYYSKQKELWVNGIGEIPGTLVHKTQEQQIKHRNTGKIFRPTCRDVDLLIHQEIKKSRDIGEALVIIKGRGIGLSCEMGCLANYFMRVYPGSTSLFTSSEQAKISTLFSEKVMTTFNKYDEDIRPKIKRLNDTKNSVYLKAEVRSVDSEGKEFIGESEIYCKQTADSDIDASGFSGKGCIFGAYDELFLHKRRHLLLKSSSSCYIEQESGKVVGFLLCGGSVEETLTNEELNDLAIMIKDVEESGRLGTLPARLLFIPASWGKFMTNGHSDHKKAKEWWDKEIESLSKLEDQSSLRAFRMNNPMTKADIFDLASSTFFEEDVMEKIKFQLDELKKPENRVPEAPYVIVKVGDKVEAKPVKKSDITLIEPPKERVDYVCTMDSIAAGTDSKSEKGSMVASIIWKLFDPDGWSYSPIGLYYAEPKKVEHAYISTIDLCHYFDKFGNFKAIAAEGNAATSDHLSTYLEKEGLSKWIPYEKKLMGTAKSTGKRKFLYVTEDIKNWQIKQMNIILRKYIQNFRMKAVLKDFLKPVSENADIRSSALMLPTYLGANFDKPVEKKKPIIYSRMTIRNVNGRNLKFKVTEVLREGKPEEEKEFVPVHKI